MGDSFSTASTLRVNEQDYRYFSLNRLAEKYDISHLPYCLKILLENLLRHEDGVDVTRSDIEAMCRWDPAAEPDTEIVSGFEESVTLKDHRRRIVQLW